MMDHFLAPDIVAAILNGRHPPQLTANRLMDDTRLPLDWSAQRELLYSYSAEAASFSPDVHRRLRLASRSLTKNCGLDRETAVLPTHATRDEAAKRRRLAHQKSL